MTKNNELTLAKTKKKLLKKSSSASLIGERLSPSRVHLRSIPLSQPRLEDTESYCRSANSPHTKQAKNDAHLECTKKTPSNGVDRAHVGGYVNVIEMMGDKSSGKKIPPTTSDGNSVLYDASLKYKTDMCEYIRD